MLSSLYAEAAQAAEKFGKHKEEATLLYLLLKFSEAENSEILDRLRMEVSGLVSELKKKLNERWTRSEMSHPLIVYPKKAETVAVSVFSLGGGVCGVMTSCNDPPDPNGRSRSVLHSAFNREELSTLIAGNALRDGVDRLLGSKRREPFLGIEAVTVVKGEEWRGLLE